MEKSVELLKSNLRLAGLADWLEEWDIRNIYEKVSKLETGQTYLEIGVAHGASLAIAAYAAKEGVNVYGIDILNQPDRDEKMAKFFSLMGRVGKYNYIEGESQLWARYWKYGPIDLLFIDGDHTYDGVVKDIASWTPNVKSGGTIMFDDYNKITGVKEAIGELLFEHCAFRDQKIDGEMFLTIKR